MTSFAPFGHMATVKFDRIFADVIISEAAKNNRTFEEEVIKLAIAGMECRRTHKEK